MFNKFIAYIRASRVELKKVAWLSKDEVKNHTLVVIGISLSVAVILGFFDFSFVEPLKILAK